MKNVASEALDSPLSGGCTSSIDSADQYGAFRVVRARFQTVPPASSVAYELQPCVSVLLAVHNAAATVEQAVQSVLMQGMQSLELLVADDGSTDNTLVILQALAAFDPRIVLVRQPNLGLTRTLNRLLALARGVFIARQDADDLWLEGKLQAQVDRMQCDPKLALLGTHFLLDHGNGAPQPAPSTMSITGDGPLRAALACYNPFMHASVLMRSEALRRCGGYDDRYDVAQDYELWLRLATMGKIDILPLPLCIRREQFHSAMQGKIGRQRRNVLLAKLRHGAWRGSNVHFWYYLLKDMGVVLLSWARSVARRAFRRIVGLPVSSALNVKCNSDAPHSACLDNRNISALFCSVRADWGGGPEHLYQLLRHVPHGVIAHVACPKGDVPYGDRFAGLIGAARCVDIPHRRFSVIALVRLLLHIRSHDIDVLHSHGKGAGVYMRLAALLTGKPCVHTFHGIHLDRYGKFGRWAYVVFEQLCGLVTTTAIAVSESELRVVLAKRFCSPRRLIAISNGVEIPDARVARAQGAPFPVVHISRFDVAKNSCFIEVLLKELKRIGRHNDFMFILVGDGDEQDSLRKALRASGLDDRVFFAGFQKNPEMYFAGALCYFSCSRWEGMPLSAMEAMAHGLPVIASDVRGNADVVRHGSSGLLYPSGCATSAATALCSLADDSTFADTLARTAYQDARRCFDVRHMAQTTYAVLRSAARADEE